MNQQGRHGNPTQGRPPATPRDALTAEAAERSRGIHNLVEDRLGDCGQRYTPGRRSLVDLLLQARQPVSIGDISDALPELPRSSAYRHLADLQSASVVRRLAAGDDFARFELVEELTQHHHHLLCTRCGGVIDIASTPAFECTVADYLDRLTKAEGFLPQSHRIDVFGLCAGCR